MGVTNVTLASFKEVISASFPGGLIGETVIELGDQQIYIAGKEQVLFKTYPFFDYAAFISIDWHGNNGVMKLDFREPMPESLLNKADLLTNFGFTEHVDNQFMTWKNINDLVKVGGKIICELPAQENFPGHLDCPYYTLEFFQLLALKCDYEIDSLRYQQHTIPIAGQVVWAVLTKTKSEFISKEEFAEVESKLGRN